MENKATEKTPLKYTQKENLQLKLHNFDCDFEWIQIFLIIKGN